MMATIDELEQRVRLVKAEIRSEKELSLATLQHRPSATAPPSMRCAARPAL
jgi:hypothetical protein